MTDLSRCGQYMIKPFDPFPISGEYFTQPSGVSIAPIVSVSGGHPDTMAGYKKNHVLHSVQQFVIAATTANWYLDSSEADSNGQIGNFNLGSVVAERTPFVFVPITYSVTVRNLNLAPGHVVNAAFQSMTVYLVDTIKNVVLWSNSPSVPNVAIAILGTDILIPPIRFDNFVDIDNFLVYLQNVSLNAAVVISNNAATAQTIELTQTLVYDIEKVT